MRIKLIIAVIAISVMALLSGCEKAPQVEIAATLVNIQTAQTAGADVYVPEAYQALLDSMKKVNEQLATQEAKTFPKYAKTKDLLLVINQLSTDAITKTDVRKVELKAETETLINEVKAQIIENELLITRAPRGKEGNQAVEAIKADNETSKVAIAEAEVLLSNGKIVEANDKIKSAKLASTGLNAELKDATDKAAK